MKKRRTIFVVVLLLLLLLLWLLRWGRHHHAPAVSSPTNPPTPIVAPVAPLPLTPEPTHTMVSLKTKIPAAPILPTTPVVSTFTVPVPVVPSPPPPAVIPPGQEGMHRELIPKNISIVRCYYNEDIVGPGETFDFDINGSGFTESFQEMIRVDLDGLDLQVMNLRLITANQIHGQIQVGSEATTQYNYPVVMIHNLPVFKAQDPFGVVRPGEVLDVALTSIDESGQFGKFQVITNLNERQFPKIRITPTSPKLEISNTKAVLPFRINGSINIAPGLSSGQYGLAVSMGNHELFRKDPLVDVVRPDVGKTGSIETVKAVEVAHRPGDLLEATMTGSGFTAGEANVLTARVDTFTTDTASFSWVSGGKMIIRLPLPQTIPEGLYGMTIFDKGKEVFKKKSVFGIVPVNWLAGVTVLEPLSAGRSATVLLKGRAITPDYAKTIQVETDEPGLAIAGVHWQDYSTIVIAIQIAPIVAPGDYILHISSAGKALTLPQGNIIKITP